MKHALGWLAALLFACAAAIASGQGLPERFDPARDAAADLDRALTMARAEGKRVIVDVGGEWCPWCHIMDRFLQRDREARGLAERHYVWLKVNFSRDNPNAAFLSRWPKVTGYPHLFVLAPDGTLLHSQDTSELEAGKDYDAERFRAFLRRFAPGSRAS